MYVVGLKNSSVHYNLQTHVQLQNSIGYIQSTPGEWCYGFNASSPSKLGFSFATCRLFLPLDPKMKGPVSLLQSLLFIPKPLHPPPPSELEGKMCTCFMFWCLSSYEGICWYLRESALFRVGLNSCPRDLHKQLQDCNKAGGGGGRVSLCLWVTSCNPGYRKLLLEHVLS